MSDTDEEMNLSYLEMPDILRGDSDEEDDIARLPASDSSLKTKKKKKPRKEYSESESSCTESESDRDSSLKKRGKSERSLQKKKKKKKSKDDSTTPKSNTASMNKSNNGSKRKKKKVSTIDMAGDVTKISKPRSKRKLKTRDVGENESSKKKNRDRTEDGGKKKKKSQRSENEIEPTASTKTKKKKKRPPSDNNDKQDREIPYGNIVRYDHNELAKQKKKPRGKRISESTLETFDYDEEDQSVCFSSKGKRKSESTEKTVDARFSSSTLGSVVETYNSSSRKNNDRRLPSVRTKREYDGEYTDADEDDEDEHHIFTDDDDEYTDDEEDVYDMRGHVSNMRRQMGYSEPLNDDSYYDSFYDLNGLDDERPSFKRVTMDLADTGIRNTKCCLVFAGLFFICTTIGTSVLIGKLTKSDEW